MLIFRYYFLSFLQCTWCAHQLWQFNDAKDNGTFSYGVNSSEINVYDTWNITWTRNQFLKSVHEVEVTVTGDNSFFFGDGRISLNVRMGNKILLMLSEIKKKSNFFHSWNVLLALTMALIFHIYCTRKIQPNSIWCLINCKLIRRLKMHGSLLNLWLCPTNPNSTINRLPYIRKKV